MLRPLRADNDTLIVHIINVWWAIPMHTMLHRGGGGYNLSVSTCSLQIMNSEYIHGIYPYTR